MAGILDICSPELVVAMDFNWDIGGVEGDSDAAGKEMSRMDESERGEKAILNILEANDFDAIPLVSEHNGQPSRIARRRYHDGDHADLFILGIEEVGVFGPRSSIMAVVFSVLSNEHHIALVGSGESIDSIVTLDTLASPGSKVPFLRRYFDQKVADVATSTGEELPADLGRRAFEGIRALADLIDSDRTMVSDRDFTQLAIDVLALLQPLKEHSMTEVDLESVPHRRTSGPLSRDVIAADFMRPFMVGVREESTSSVTEWAREILSLANDFSNILLLSIDGEPIGLFRRSKGSWLLDKVGFMNPSKPIEDVLIRLSNRDSRGVFPLVIIRMEEGGFGIITQEEASSDIPVFWILKRLSVLERGCRKFLASNKISQVPRYKDTSDMVSIDDASFGQILHGGGMFVELLGSGKIWNLVNFRNEIVHKVVSDMDTLDIGKIRLALNSIRGLEGLVSSEADI